MAEPMTIEVSTADQRVAINGWAVATAPTVPELHLVLGTPSRVEDGYPPAPVKHRNQQVHVYDALGLDFIEHHYTRRITQVRCWFDVTEPQFHFTPAFAFGGRLIIDGVTMPAHPTEVEFLATRPPAMRRVIAGIWASKVGGIYLGIGARGRRLPSGRRSKTRQVEDVSIGWPHDDWQRSPA